MFWGLTPSLDLLQYYKKNVTELPEEVNILIVGGADCRHVLQTLARRYRHKKVRINFYIVESCVETIAKQLLLIYIALQPQKSLGLVQKTRIFMELYGNTLIRPMTAKYLTKTANELIKMVTNYDYLTEIIPNVCIEIKYKERDYLENLITFWCSGGSFDICKIWDLRLRKLLGVRYDSKLGAFDWDLHMRFHSVGGKQVCNQEFRNFRSNGTAFSWLESEVSKPNRTMVCVIVPNGKKFVHYGYLGDMVTGPFVSFGLDCEDEEFNKSTNGQNTYRSTDVTERNLMQLFHELEFNTNYEHKPVNDMKLGPLTINYSEKLVVDFKEVNFSRKAATKCFEIENAQINFLSISALNLMKHRKEYENFFNIIYFGSTYLKYIDKELLNFVSATNALLIIENQKYVLNLRDKQLEEHFNNIKGNLEGIDLKKFPFSYSKDDYFKFVVKVSSDQ